MTYNETMTDVAFKFLSKRKREVEFLKLWTEIAKEMKIPEEKLKRKKAQFYSELLLDNRFASLENNKWDLRNRRKYEEVHANTENIDDVDDEEETDEPLYRNGLDLPTGDDAFDN